MNAAKTQLLFSSRAGNVTITTVEVDESIIHPGDVIELLGVKYDRRLSTGPHTKVLLAAVRQRASVVCRRANHLPRGEYLWQLAYGLVIEKFSHALAAVARPRLEQEDNASVVWSGIQVALNDIAQSITGTRRRDHVRFEDLLAQAGLESANRMVVKARTARVEKDWTRTRRHHA
jgi:23S rRNA U2552 (ribose-2'-O)-methylase RlmE/FtsJ